MVIFKISPDRAGQYRWALIANNNEIIAVSEGYVTKQGAIISAERVRQLAPRALIQDTTVVRRLP